MPKDTAFLANGVVLFFILLFALALFLYQSPQDQSNFYKGDIVTTMSYIDSAVEAGIRVDHDTHMQLLSDAMKVVSLRPYDRQSWIFLSALLDVEKERLRISDDNFSPAEKAKIIARALQPDISANVDLEVDAVFRSLAVLITHTPDIPSGEQK